MSNTVPQDHAPDFVGGVDVNIEDFIDVNTPQVAGTGKLPSGRADSQF
jgi:hypothetical protein